MGTTGIDLNPPSSTAAHSSAIDSGLTASAIHITGVDLYWLPIETRVPLKFGTETLTSVTCARVCIHVQRADGQSATGWGETPLSVQWAWPSSTSYAQRHQAMKSFCEKLASAWAGFDATGHALEIGHAFQRDVLPQLLSQANQQEQSGNDPMPLLAALVCCSAFDIALHDAYGHSVGRPIYETFTAQYLRKDLASYLTPADGSTVDFHGKFPGDYLETPFKKQLPAWHLVGGLDPLSPEEMTTVVKDGEPVLLKDWIERDGLDCLKIKLRGTDASWDFDRLVFVGELALAYNVTSLTADFNCTVTDPQYVIDILDRVATEHPAVYQRILYVEQPFPYELERDMIDVHALAAMKPLLMDESAHDWQHVKLGHSLGWNGVALKTCKTQTGAILAFCWARAHGMHLMVQDLTNPMLAQIPHLLLAAHIPTMRGVETNGMQFYPEASAHEAKVHPGVYRRRHGQVDLSTIDGPGFGYRVDEIARPLPPAACQFHAK